MIDTPRIALLASVALAAALVVGCVSPGKRPAATSLAGVVRDPQGQPIPSVWIEVEGHPKPLQSPPAWRTDVHGRFEMEDIPPGPVKLIVSPGDLYSSVTEEKVVETRTGVRDLVIVVDPGPQLFLRIVGYVPASQVRWARLTWEEPDGEDAGPYPPIRYAPIRADGWVRFVALPPDGEFVLYAEAEVDRRYVLARGLKPGQTEQRIEREAVKDIAGKVQGRLRGRLTADVYAHPGPGAFSGLRLARTWVKDDGTFRIRGLPPGTYLVDVGSRGGEVFSVSKNVVAGTTDVVFTLD